MTRLPAALACLILAAILAAVAYVLARPRWGWERPERAYLRPQNSAAITENGWKGWACKPSTNPLLTITNVVVRNAPSVSRDSTVGWREAGWS